MLLVTTLFVLYFMISVVTYTIVAANHPSFRNLVMREGAWMFVIATTADAALMAWFTVILISYS